MNLRAYAVSDVGLRRKANEDCYALAPEVGLFLVADGMGGHIAGQLASETAAGSQAPDRPLRTNGAKTNVQRQMTNP